MKEIAPEGASGWKIVVEGASEREIARGGGGVLDYPTATSSVRASLTPETKGIS